jgi:hypothetical protein
MNAVESHPFHQNHLNQEQHNIVQDVVEMGGAGRWHLLMMKGGSILLEWQPASVGQQGCHINQS